MLQRLGRTVEAAQAYDAALAGTDNATERDFLQRPREALNPRFTRWLIRGRRAR